MTIIAEEYPRGQRTTEMTLVEMLNEKRSWNDYMEISNALWNLRYRAKLMQDEKKKLNAKSGGNEAESNKAQQW